MSAEILTIVITSWAPQSTITSITKNGLLGHVSSMHISPEFIVGWIMVVAGALIRMACFKYLGRHFTFELSLRDNHTLITDGPYSIVRHPSYTGMTIMIIGLMMCLVGRGSWTESVGLWSSWIGKAFLIFWLANLAFPPVMMMFRVGQEDRMLRNEFKDQWERWSKRTPYKLVPCIY